MLLGGLMLELAHVRALTVTQAFFSGQRSTIPCVESSPLFEAVYIGPVCRFWYRRVKEVACSHGNTMCL
jgi:hypothetical protein